MDTGVDAINQGDWLYHEQKNLSPLQRWLQKGSFQPFDLNWPGT